MTQLTPEELSRLAVETWGAPAQTDMVIEELSELLLAIQHHKRGRVTADAIGEEMADVRIMLDQLQVIYPKVDHVTWLASKRARLQTRLEAVEARQSRRAEVRP